MVIEIDGKTNVFEFSNVFFISRKVAEANRILAMVRVDGQAAAGAVVAVPS
jgi:hypothetical protein